MAKPTANKDWSLHVQDALRADDRYDVIQGFVDALRESIRDGHASLRRSLLLTVVFATTFFIVEGSTTVEAEIFGFKVTDVALTAKLVPPVVAYLAYEAFFSAALVGRLRETLAAVVPVLSPQLGSVNAHRLLYPPTPSIMAESFHFGPEQRPRPWRDLPGTRKVFDGAVWVGMGAAALAVPGFLVYAYVSLFSTYGMSDLLTLMSAVVSLSFTVRFALLPHVVKEASGMPPVPDYPAAAETPETPV